MKLCLPVIFFTVIIKATEIEKRTITTGRFILNIYEPPFRSQLCCSSSLQMLYFKSGSTVIRIRVTATDIWCLNCLLFYFEDFLVTVFIPPCLYKWFIVSTYVSIYYCFTSSFLKCNHFAKYIAQLTFHHAKEKLIILPHHICISQKISR